MWIVTKIFLLACPRETELRNTGQRHCSLSCYEDHHILTPLPEHWLVIDALRDIGP